MTDMNDDYFIHDEVSHVIKYCVDNIVMHELLARNCKLCTEEC
jgi:hypothetical protein